MALLLNRQAKHASKSPGGGRVPPSAKRLCTPCLCRYRLAGLLSPPGATLPCYPLESALSPGATLVLA